MRMPIRPLQDRWPGWLESRAGRLFWNDPRVMLQADVSPDAFRAAMNAVHVGGTIKITGTGRHPKSDDLLIRNVDLAGKHIVDMGASDGSTSADLVGRLPDFGRYTIADLHLYIGHRRVGRRDVFYDAAGSAILVVGPRLVAWPSLSRFVRALYLPVLRRAERSGRSPERVLLLNPVARNLIARDPRVSYREHDIFTPWAGAPADVIKVANLLRRLYFSDEAISEALDVLARDLPEGGFLLIVDNPRIEGIVERGGLYRLEDGRFVVVAETPDRPEIADLIERVRPATTHGRGGA